MAVWKLQRLLLQSRWRLIHRGPQGHLMASNLTPIRWLVTGVLVPARCYACPQAPPAPLSKGSDQYTTRSEMDHTRPTPHAPRTIISKIASRGCHPVPENTRTLMGAPSAPNQPLWSLPRPPSAAPGGWQCETRLVDQRSHPHLRFTHLIRSQPPPSTEQRGAHRHVTAPEFYLTTQDLWGGGGVGGGLTPPPTPLGPPPLK